MSYPITAIATAICGLILLILAIDTVRQRLRTHTAFGEGDGDVRLIQAMRAHGNLAEHAPIALLLIGLLEGAKVHHMALTALAAFFLFARVMHAWGLYLPIKDKPPVPRQIGVIGTWLSLATLSIWTLVTVARLNF